MSSQSTTKSAMFDRCRTERRTLITSSYKLLLRRECPAGAYLMDSKSTSALMEQSLPTLYAPTAWSYPRAPSSPGASCAMAKSSACTRRRRKRLSSSTTAPRTSSAGRTWRFSGATAAGRGTGGTTGRPARRRGCSRRRQSCCERAYAEGSV